jgi:hypothetical protein
MQLDVNRFFDSVDFFGQITFFLENDFIVAVQGCSGAA